MSKSPFPFPRTSNFNPSAWDFTTYYKYLNSFLTYPTAQSGTAEFTTVFVPATAVLTHWINTLYATTEISTWASANIPALLPVAQTWALLQYYFGGIRVDTINPTTTGGTLLIGNGSTINSVEVATVASRSVVLHLGDGNTSTGAIHINNGTNTSGDVNILNGTGSTGTITLGVAGTTIHLNCPLSSTRIYPNIPLFLSNGTTTNYGKVGAIGFVTVRCQFPGTRFPGSNGLVYAFTDLNLSLPVGVWYLVGEIVARQVFGNTNGISFGLTSPANPLVARPATFFGGNFTVRYSSDAQNNSVLPFFGGAMTCASVYVNNTGSNQTVNLYQFQNSYGWVNSGLGYFTAVRIA
jgi:hypothetical protein